MKILITGGTGFIGKNIVEELSKNKKHSITCIIRHKSKQQDVDFLTQHGCTLLYGDLSNNNFPKRTIRDFDAIINCAGQLGSYNSSFEELKKNNVETTKTIIEHCTQHQKVIHISSAGLLGPIKNGTEKSTIQPKTAYETSKAMAEEIVKKHPNYVILRPEFVYGPHDMHVLQLFKHLQKKIVFFIGSGINRIQPTYIGDVVQAVEQTLQPQVKNEVFIIAGKISIPFNTFLKLISKELNADNYIIRIPVFLCKLYTFFVEPITRTLNINPLITDSRIHFFTETRTFSIEKSRTMLHYDPIEIKQGIQKTIKWYKKKKYL